ncbi:MAG TPA: tetratricopeptide repeat protein [Myxococcota bacterium]|nr:tetratricopeptide repeat protein [Myxococcota bacterium]HOD07513.1 tetratricopeptide repeat protein [Myxococcota bacterium]
MSGECENNIEHCAQIKRTIVASATVVIAVTLVALFVLMLPVAKGWRNSVNDRQKRADAAAMHVAAGDAAFAAGLYEDALMEYVVATGLNPSDLSVQNRQSRARVLSIAFNPTVMDSLNLAEIRGEVAIVKAAFPEDATNAQVVAALIKFREGTVTDAINMLNEIGADSASAAVHLAKAMLYQHVPEFESSVAAEFDAALAARPDDYRLQGIAGDYFLSVGEVQKGIDLIRKASGKVRNLNWLKVLSAFAVNSGDKEGASKDIQVALKMAPRDPEVLSIYGQVLINSGKFAEASEVLQEAVSIRENRETLLQLGMAYNGMKRYDRALQVLTKVVQAGQDAISLYEYGNALAGTGNIDEALKVYNAVLSARDGAGTQEENRILMGIKEQIRTRIGQISAGNPAGKK